MPGSLPTHVRSAPSHAMLPQPPSLSRPRTRHVCGRPIPCTSVTSQRTVTPSRAHPASCSPACIAASWPHDCISFHSHRYRSAQQPPVSTELHRTARWRSTSCEGHPPAYCACRDDTFAAEATIHSASRSHCAAEPCWLLVRSAWRKWPVQPALHRNTTLRSFLTSSSHDGSHHSLPSLHFLPPPCRSVTSARIRKILPRNSSNK